VPGKSELPDVDISTGIRRPEESRSVRRQSRGNLQYPQGFDTGCVGRKLPAYGRRSAGVAAGPLRPARAQRSDGRARRLVQPAVRALHGLSPDLRREHQHELRRSFYHRGRPFPDRAGLDEAARPWSAPIRRTSRR
jgi:hypothetical protein